jgi:8-oxo-dGTP diphosphatase
MTIDKLAWIEIKDKSILSTRSFGKDKYYLPGGKREQGESDAEALAREIKEELSVDIDVDTMQFVGIFEAQAHGHPKGVTVKMTCYTANYAGTLKADSEIEMIAWLRHGDKNRIAEVDKLIFDYLEERRLIV